MKVSVLFLILITACVVHSQYYYYYYPQYYNPYYQYYHQFYQQPQYQYYYYQFQMPLQFMPPQFPSFVPSLSTTPRSTTYRFGIFPESFVNFDLIGSSGLSRGTLIGRGLGALVQLIAGK